LAFFQTLRLERATHLVKTKYASVDEVAALVGYSDGTTLRTLLRRRLNMGINEIRRAH
jgi:transcriptional regulator GlxA family with amidase domain